MRAEIQVRPLQESEYNQWAQFVAGASSGSIYALPAHLDILSGVTNARFTILGAFWGDELVGGAPLYLTPSKLGLLAVRRYFLSYHGLVMRDYTSRIPSERSSRHVAILTALAASLRTFNCIHMVLCIRHTISDIRPFLAGGWKVVPDYTYLVDITDLSAAWARMAQNLRRLVSRAEGMGLTISDDDDFESFYRLHRQVHERKHTALYLPEAAFRTFFARLKSLDLCRLYHARLPDGRSIAAQLVLTGAHPVRHTACAASDGAHHGGPAAARPDS